MSIQAVSFGATTKNGNQYKKTNVGKIVGAALGVTSAATACMLAPKTPSISILRKMVDARQQLLASGCTKEAAKKVLSRTFKAGFVGGMVGAVLGYIGIGAITDAIVNKIRANKADKIAKNV